MHERKILHRHDLELRKLSGEWTAKADYLNRNAGVDGRGVSQCGLRMLAASAKATLVLVGQLQLDRKAMQSAGMKWASRRS